ncbi:MAG: hypothetical protein FWC70_12145 [Defluviitaleaceae bacterium]|nr:hypothetical protein [Defluviitaleaceae bacterium]
MKARRVIRVIFTAVGAVLFFLGVGGYFVTMGNMSADIGRFYNQVPLHAIRGIAVDSQGNAFWGSGSHSSIQVYNNYGIFLYRFSFPTGSGDWTFYIDSDDVVHVATARGARLLSFKDGILLFESRAENSDMVREFDSRRQAKVTDNYGNIYRIRHGVVRMYDEGECFIRTIRPNAPIWPFHPVMMFGIAVVGLLIAVSCNAEWISGQVREAQKMRASRTPWGL